MNCLIVGYGSIGSRHGYLLNRMGHRVYGLDNIKQGQVCFESVEEAFKEQAFDYVIICNRTCDHYETLLELMKQGFRGLLLIEKPLFDRVRPLPEYGFDNAFVAYNLRFHPVIQDILPLVCGRKFYSIQVYVGQYLPEWRPLTDYRSSYSASRAAGGGALRDLSHELDYVNWITGGWKSVAALGGTFSDLRIDSDDTYGLLIETEKCPVVLIQMNYLDRKLRREMIINLEGMSLKADLVANTLEINSECRCYQIHENQTYLNQHNAILSGMTGHLCTLDQGIDVLRLVEGAEEAAGKRVWKWR